MRRGRKGRRNRCRFRHRRRVSQDRRGRGGWSWLDVVVAEPPCVLVTAFPNRVVVAETPIVPALVALVVHFSQIERRASPQSQHCAVFCVRDRLLIVGRVRQVRSASPEPHGFLLPLVVSSVSAHRSVSVLELLDFVSLRLLPLVLLVVLSRCGRVLRRGWLILVLRTSRRRSIIGTLRRGRV